MQKYLEFIQNYPNSIVIAIAAMIFIIGVIVVLWMSINYKKTIKRLQSELNGLIQAHALEHARLTDQLSAAESKLQQLQLDVEGKTKQIDEAIEEKQVLQTEAQRALALESDIQQQNQQIVELFNVVGRDFGVNVNAFGQQTAWLKLTAMIAELSHQFQIQKQRQADLEQERLFEQNALADKEAALADKDAALDDLRDVVNEQAKHLLEIEQNFKQKLQKADKTLASLQAKYDSYQAYFGKLAMNRIGVFTELNNAMRRIRQLEAELTQVNQELAGKQTESPLATAIIAPVIEAAPIAQLPDSPVAEVTETANAEIKSANPLLSRFFKTVKTDFGLDKSVADTKASDSEQEGVVGQEDKQVASASQQTAVIARLNAEIDAQQRHIARLEDMLNSQSREARPEVNASEETAEVNSSVRDVNTIAITKAKEFAAHFPEEMKEQWQSWFKKAPEVKAKEPEPVSITTEENSDSNDNAPPKTWQGIVRKIKSMTS